MTIFEDFFNISNDLMTIADTNGRILHVNAVYTTFTGWAVEELKSKTYWELIHPEDHEKVISALRTLQAGHPIFGFEYRFLCKDGSYKTLLANVTQNKKTGHLYAISRLRTGQVTSYIIFADITPTAVLIVDIEGNIIYSNILANNMFGYEAGELPGKQVEILIPKNLQSRHQSHRAQFHLNPSTRPMGSNYKLVGLKKDGSTFQVDIALNPLQEQSKLYVACSIFDITEKIHTSELTHSLEKENLRLEKLAHRDPLTQAYNRRSMDELFPILAQECQAEGKNISTMMVDIDHFKKFNDTYGHPVGDKLLVEFAGIIQSLIREKDGLIRYGGEEFFIIMPNCEQQKALEVAERIRSTLANAPILGCMISASFGVSTHEFKSNEMLPKNLLNKLIKETDQALYAAKKSGRNCARHFNQL